MRARSACSPRRSTYRARARSSARRGSSTSTRASSGAGCSRSSTTRAGRSSRVAGATCGSRPSARAFAACRRSSSSSRRPSTRTIAPPERVVVGCTEAVSSEVLPSAVAALRKEMPGVTVAVRRLGTEECVARLVAGEIDVGVARGAPFERRWPRELDAILLGRDRLWIAAKRTHAIARARTVRLRDVAREPLVLYASASATRRRVMSALAPLGASVAVEVDGRASALAYARRGFGVAFLSLLPRCIPRAPGVRLREVTRLFPPAAFWLLVPRASAGAAASRLAELMARHTRGARTLRLTAE